MRSTSLFLLAAMLACPAGADMRGLSWGEFLAPVKSICLGRLTSVESRRSSAGLDSEYLLSVETTSSVMGDCPPRYRVVASDSWELTERPTEADAEYLFFLPPSTGTGDALPSYRIGYRSAWRRLSMQGCWGDNWEYLYVPRLVFVPEEVYSRQCVSQILPLGGTVQTEQRVLRETLLFAYLKKP